MDMNYIYIMSINHSRFTRNLLKISYIFPRGSAESVSRAIHLTARSKNRALLTRTSAWCKPGGRVVCAQSCPTRPEYATEKGKEKNGRNHRVGC